jgi:cytidyltransferase-like protein
LKVLTFGNFDFIHPGHIHYLNFAKKQGSKLFTVVASDEISEKIKQRKNVFNQNQRIQQIKRLKISDEVLKGSNKNPFQILIQIKPDIIVLGYDQKAPIKNIKDLLPNSKIIRAPEFKSYAFKSSLIKKNVFNTSSL